MPKFPDPDVARVKFAGLETVAIQDQLWRIYFAGGDHPSDWDSFRHYGPAVNAGRFDHHPPPPKMHADRSIYYAASSIPVCVAEVFQDSRTVDIETGTPKLVLFMPTRALHLLDFRNVWPTRAGASQAISSGPRARSQRWSATVYATFGAVDGVLYRSSMYAGEDAIALYERANDAIPDHPLVDEPLDNPRMRVVVKRVADRLGYGFR